jgi:hypothetical protein
MAGEAGLLALAASRTPTQRGAMQAPARLRSSSGSVPASAMLTGLAAAA